MLMKRRAALVGMGLVLLLVSTAPADLYRVTYEATLSAEELEPPRGPEFPVFGRLGVESSVFASFIVDTTAPPAYEYAAGDPVGGYTALHDFYGYELSTISDLTATFGSKTWDTSDVYVPDLTAGSAAVWFDAPLHDGATPHMMLRLVDSDGLIYLNGMYRTATEYGMYSDGSFLIIDNDGDSVRGEGATVTVTRVVPVPSAAILGIVGLAAAGSKLRKRRGLKQ